MERLPDATRRAVERCSDCGSSTRDWRLLLSPIGEGENRRPAGVLLCEKCWLDFALKLDAD